MTALLPRLLTHKELTRELGVKDATGYRIMREAGVVRVGRRVYVTDTAVRDYLKSEDKS